MRLFLLLEAAAGGAATLQNVQLKNKIYINKTYRLSTHQITGTWRDWRWLRELGSTVRGYVDLGRPSVAM